VLTASMDKEVISSDEDLAEFLAGGPCIIQLKSHTNDHWFTQLHHNVIVGHNTCVLHRPEAALQP
jgi:hypothetical protein